jgi:hypothetical protein
LRYVRELWLQKNDWEKVFASVELHLLVWLAEEQQPAKRTRALTLFCSRAVALAFEDASPYTVTVRATVGDVM